MALIAMCFALAPILTLLVAQQPTQPRIEYMPTTGTPQFAGVYHPQHGFREATDRRARFGPDLIWNSPPLTNYYSVPGANQEWIDGGTLQRRHADPREQFNSVEFTYCTSDENPNGLQTTLRFYDEHVECQGPPAWPAASCTYVLTGLPEHQNAQHHLSCWTVAVDLSGFECELALDPVQNRMFGWSSTWSNDDTGPWLAQSYQPGVDNSWVWFDRTTMQFLGCWWFGGLAMHQFDLKLWGQPPEVFAYGPQGAVGDDMDLALEASHTAIGGGRVQFRMNDLEAGHRVATSGVLFASAAPAEVDLQARFGIDATLLLDVNQLLWRSDSSTGSHVTPRIPPSAQGKSIYVQGVQTVNALPTRVTAHALEMVVQ